MAHTNPTIGMEDWGDDLNAALDAIDSNADSKVSSTILTTKGDLLTRDASGLVRKPIGTDGQVVTADGTQPVGWKWADPPAGTGGGSGTLGSAAWFNVKDEGAVGNGIADDTAAIQAALDAANAAGGGVVYIPHGTYKFVSQLDTFDNVTIQGDGNTATILRISVPGEHGIYYTSAADGPPTTGCTIRDLTVYGPTTIATLQTVPVAGLGNGIYAVGESLCGLRVENVSVRGFRGKGIYCSGPIVTKFDHVTCEVNGGHAFHMDGSIAPTVTTSLLFSNCYARNNLGDGYFQEGPTTSNGAYSAYIGCAADDNQNNYHFKTIRGISMVGCGSEGHTGADPRVKTGSNGVLIEGGTAITLQNCFLYNANLNDIYITSSGATPSREITVEGCRTSNDLYSTYLKVDANCSVRFIDNNVSTAGYQINANAKVRFEDLYNGKYGFGTYPNSQISYDFVDNATIGETMRVQNINTGNDTRSLIYMQTGDVNKVAASVLVNGEAVRRWKLYSDGKQEWSDGASIDTNLYRADANVLATDDAMRLATAGKGLELASGANARCGVVTLVNGTVTVPNNTVTANTRILLSYYDIPTGSTPGHLMYSRSGGVSFTIQSRTTGGSAGDNTADQSQVTYLMIEVV